MTGVFRANYPYNNFLLLLYALVLKFPMFLHAHIPQTGIADGFLYPKLLDLMQLSGFPPVAPAILAFILIFTQATVLNYLCNHFKLTPHPNYLTGMSYILISSLFSEWFTLSSAMIANTFFIWIIYGLAGINSSQKIKSTLFNLGLILGIACFFYYPALFFLFLVLVGLAFMRPFRIAEWLMVVLGFLTPFYFLVSILFLNNRLTVPTLPEPVITLPFISQLPWAISSLALIGFSALVGVYFINLNMRRQIVHIRKFWSLIFFYSLFAVLVPFLNNTRSFHDWILAVVPISMMAGVAFLSPQKKWFRVFVHWAMVLVALVMGYYFR
ncbi:MAG: hypothetical protein KIS82_04175 [Ferruginibacter sp.]|nr:hypothetical protein [Bacteroidota bacterium]MCW5916527.1 hypothetical protein [Ferruginibacter sp.]